LQQAPGEEPSASRAKTRLRKAYVAAKLKARYDTKHGRAKAKRRRVSARRGFAICRRYSAPDLSRAVGVVSIDNHRKSRAFMFGCALGKAIRTARLKPGAICSKELVRPRRAEVFARFLDLYGSNVTLTEVTPEMTMSIPFW
jgi:hypothetical protein